MILEAKLTTGTKAERISQRSVSGSMLHSVTALMGGNRSGGDTIAIITDSLKFTVWLAGL